MAAMANKVDDTVLGEYILMEYCKFGNLDSQLMKAAVDMPPNNTERWLPESVLWRIFDCLVKACMAMQCPPRYVPANPPPAAAPVAGPAPAPQPTSGAYLPEVVAPGTGQIAGHHGLVHFDLVGSFLTPPPRKPSIHSFSKPEFLILSSGASLIPDLDPISSEELSRVFGTFGYFLDRVIRNN